MAARTHNGVMAGSRVHSGARVSLPRIDEGGMR